MRCDDRPPRDRVLAPPEIDALARVARGAALGRGVRVGPFSAIGDNVEIGAGSTVQGHCLVGFGGSGRLKIGTGSLIRSHNVVYCGSVFGDGLETGHHVVLREGTIAGANLRVGNFSDIEGDCSIGDYCRLHGYVHIGKGARIGHFVWLFSLTIATNDPLPPSAVSEPVTIEDGAVICVGVTLMPGTVVGKGAFVTAGTIARGTIPPGAVVAGPDGQIVSHVSRLFHIGTATRHPWMSHFRKGFPEEAQQRLDQLEKEILESRHLF